LFSPLLAGQNLVPEPPHEAEEAREGGPHSGGHPDAALHVRDQREAAAAAAATAAGAAVEVAGQRSGRE